MNSKEDNWFYKLAATLLLLTALAKLYSVWGSARVLQIQDQLLHLGYRPVMILAALIEAAVAFFLLKGRSDLSRSLVLLWLSSNLIAYRLEGRSPTCSTSRPERASVRAAICD